MEKNERIFRTAIEVGTVTLACAVSRRAETNERESVRRGETRESQMSIYGLQRTVGEFLDFIRFSAGKVEKMGFRG